MKLIVVILISFFCCISVYSQVSKSDTQKIMSPRVSLSGGVGLFVSEDFGRNSSSYVVDLEGTYFLSRSAGLRLSVNCNFFGNSRDNNYYYPGFYEEGGNLSMYIASIDILLGNLKPDKKTNGYFVGGTGLFILSESERKSSYYDYSYTSAGESYTFAGLKLGGGFNHKFSKNVTAGSEFLYALPFQFPQIGVIALRPKINFKVSKNLSVFIQPQYAFPIAFSEYGGFFFDMGYFTVKSGITLGSF